MSTLTAIGLALVVFAIGFVAGVLWLVWYLDERDAQRDRAEDSIWDQHDMWP